METGASICICILSPHPAPVTHHAARRPGESGQGPRSRESTSAPEDAQGRGARSTSRAAATALSPALPRGSKQNSRTPGRGDRHCEAAPGTLRPFPSEGRTWCLMQQGGSVRCSRGVWVCGHAGLPGASQKTRQQRRPRLCPLSLLSAVGGTASPGRRNQPHDGTRSSSQGEIQLGGN